MTALSRPTNSSNLFMVSPLSRGLSKTNCKRDWFCPSTERLLVLDGVHMDASENVWGLAMWSKAKPFAILFGDGSDYNVCLCFPKDLPDWCITIVCSECESVTNGETSKWFHDWFCLSDGQSQSLLLTTGLSYAPQRLLRRPSLLLVRPQFFIKQLTPVFQVEQLVSGPNHLVIPLPRQLRVVFVGETVGQDFAKFSTREFVLFENFFEPIGVIVCQSLSFHFHGSPCLSKDY